jgi:hypothetical protein
VTESGRSNKKILTVGENMLGSIRAPADFMAGALFVAVGTAALVVGRDYRMGSLLSMGPGYFPRIVSVLLVGFGLLVMVNGLRTQGAMPDRPLLRPLVLVLAAVASFGLGIESLGLVLSTALLVALSCAAQPGRSWLEAGLLAAGLSLVGWAVFVKGLGLTFPVWPQAAG